MHRGFGNLDIGIGIPWQNLQEIREAREVELFIVPFDSTTNPTMCRA